MRGITHLIGNIKPASRERGFKLTIVVHPFCKAVVLIVTAEADWRYFPGRLPLRGTIRVQPCHPSFHRAEAARALSSRLTRDFPLNNSFFQAKIV